VIRLLLADDHAMVREALATLLRLEGDFEVVAGVADGLGVLAAARATRPDLALIDIEMPGSDGLTVAETLTRELPEVKVVIVTAFGRPGFLRRALEAGVSGYLLKDRPAAELAFALRRVLSGARVVDPELAVAALSEGANPLSPRELEVLAAAHGGAPLSELAATLHLSVGTVKNHLSVAIGKLGARNRAEAIRIAEERGWLPSWSRPENRSN
jgi:two-component system response regulator DesR